MKENKLLEIIYERRGLFVANPKSRSSVVQIDHPITLRKYKLKLENSDTESYVILHPAPISITKAKGSLFTPLHNNDVLFDNVKICGLKYFLDDVI